MPTVFISYRREDTSANAGRLCDWLKRHFGADNVFLDTESIAPGEAFPAILEERLAASDVLLAVIGPRWTGICDSAGNRRIADPKDFVALEVATALERGIRVIPVLVGGASMLSADQLPPALQGFEQKNAFAIDDSRFAQDFDNLVDAIVGRKRGFARRELDRFQRGARVLKAGSLIAPVLALLLLFAAWMQAFDALLLDTRVASYSMWLAQRFVGPPTESSVVLIAIDEDSEKRLGRKYGRAPEWRLDHARMIDRLATAGVAAVAFDLYIEDENESERDADAALADAIRQATQKRCSHHHRHPRSGRRRTETAPCADRCRRGAGVALYREPPWLCIQRAHRGEPRFKGRTRLARGQFSSRTRCCAARSTRSDRRGAP